MKNEIQLMHGDCLERLKELPDNSVDSIVTDPPYGLSFMGKKWDYDVPAAEVWAECLRVLKPGAHLLAFAGTRTQHRMAVRIEDAGFEIRDMIAWVYGSGFPKSLDVSKAIDKAAGAEREVVGAKDNKGRVKAEGWGMSDEGQDPITAPATDAAKQWQGWGTALKPALEPITVARKPLGEKTVAANVLAHGTGAINVDVCRVTYNGEKPSGWFNETERKNVGFKLTKGSSSQITSNPGTGRWPANLIHDGSEEVVGLFPDSNGRGGSLPNVKITGYGDGIGTGKSEYFGGERIKHNDGAGSAARFFYCAKASKADRDEGCEGIDERLTMRYGEKAQGPLPQQTPSKPVAQRNHHPTVKPTALMRYLCRLVTPSGGTVLDPFTGSGSTGKAAVLEGFDFVGIEREAEYVEIAKARIEAAKTLI